MTATHLREAITQVMETAQAKVQALKQLDTWYKSQNCAICVENRYPDGHARTLIVVRLEHGVWRAYRFYVSGDSWTALTVMP